MLPLIIFLVSFGQFYTNVVSNSIADNGIDENSFTYAEFPYDKVSNIDNLFLAEQLDDFPLVQYNPEKTLVKFQRPFTSVNIDFEKNSLLSKFRKDDELFEPNEKRQLENYNMDDEDDQRRNERSISGARDSRGDNFMRFGRSPHDDFMRFGRTSPGDFMRFGRFPHKDFMRFGRDRGADFLRLGRSELRLKRDPGSDFMRLGRSSPVSSHSDRRDFADDFMRFGRSVTWPKGVSPKHEKDLRLSKSDLKHILKNEPIQLLKSKTTKDKNLPRIAANLY